MLDIKDFIDQLKDSKLKKDSVKNYEMYKLSKENVRMMTKYQY